MLKRTLILLGVFGVCFAPLAAYGDALQWNVPNVGLINLNLTTTEALLGYDAVLKQSIGGMSLPVWTDPKGLISLQLGAVAPWPTNNATVEPYIAAGHDIAREIPGLNQYQSLHLNIFGRYASDRGKAGVGLSFSYTFAGSTPSTPPVAQISSNPGT